MQQDKSDIENKLRQLENQQLPDLSRMDEHWQEMKAVLGTTANMPPGKKHWKKITRRAITYMGVAAIVTTTTYYAVRTGSNRNMVKKNVPVSTHTKDNNKPQEKISQQTVSVPKAKPIADKNKRQVLMTQVTEESDTVFLKPKTVTGGPEILSLENLYIALKQPIQQFEIDPERDTILRGKHGTVLDIQAHSFVYPNLAPVMKPVHIKLVECYEYTDMLAHQLTTLSYNNLLVTGGMINLLAEDGDKKTLTLFYGRPIRLSMPTDKFDPDMQLFVNDAKQVRLTEKSDLLTDVPAETVTNWRPAGQPQGYMNSSRFIHPRNIKLFDVSQSVKKVNQETEPVFLVKTSKSISDDKIKQLISSKFYTDLSKIKLQRVEFMANSEKAKNTNVMITKDGFVATDSVTVSFETAAKEGYLSREDRLAFEMQVRADSLLFVEKRRADSILFVKKKEFDGRYNFSINGLGWINCDRNFNSTQPRVEFSINIGTDMQNALSNYNLVFTNIKSVLKGRYENGQVSFGKLPEGEDVKLVCVTENNNKAMACVQSFKISRGIIASLKFEEVTPQTFRQKIEKL